VIIANTTPGKGVSYMENDYRWHGSPPGSVITERTPAKEKQSEVALEQLHQKESKERGDWYSKHKQFKPLHLPPQK
jgi:transketolase